MTDVVIERFDPARADADDLAMHHEVMIASREADEPAEPPLTLEDAAERLLVSFPGMGATAHWVARRRGRIAGVAIAELPDADNDHLGVVEVVVHPEHRRRGVGSAMLAALTPHLRAANRRVIEGWQVVQGGAGEAWALALGFEPVRAVAVQRLTTATADPALWPAAASAGYRLRRWLGAAPPDIVDSYADARGAIHDAPVGGTEFRPPEWTVDKVRAGEAEMREHGIEQRVVIAVYEATGTVAAVTELIVHPSRPTWAYQGDTVVVPAHRGRGLGGSVKGHMTRWLLADHPDLMCVQTSTSADNTHMLRVNHELGYTTSRVIVVMRGDLGPAPADR